MVRPAQTSEGPSFGDPVRLLDGRRTAVSRGKVPQFLREHWVYAIVDEGGDTRYVRRSKDMDEGRVRGWSETSVRMPDLREPGQTDLRLNPRERTVAEEMRRLGMRVEPRRRGPCRPPFMCMKPAVACKTCEWRTMRINPVDPYRRLARYMQSDVEVTGPMRTGEYGDATEKRKFRTIGIGAMKQLAKDLGMREWKADFNPGGPAVSGDVSLMGMFNDRIGLYVFFNKDRYGRTPSGDMTYRTITSMKDYYGGANQWMSFYEFNNPDDVISKLRAFVEREMAYRVRRNPRGGPMATTIRPRSRHILKDQYGERVPDDLVVLSGRSPQEFSREHLRMIERASWYDVDGVILVSAREVDYYPEDDPIDAGIDLSDPKVEIGRIADALKRMSDQDGFYHA